MLNKEYGFMHYNRDSTCKYYVLGYGKNLNDVCKLFEKKLASNIKYRREAEYAFYEVDTGTDHHRLVPSDRIDENLFPFFKWKLTNANGIVSLGSNCDEFEDLVYNLLSSIVRHDNYIISLSTMDKDKLYQEYKKVFGKLPDYLIFTVRRTRSRLIEHHKDIIC